MGEIVGAALLSHVPTIMLPEAERRKLNHGRDTTLATGLEMLRQEVFDRLCHDTVVVLDSHWATTVEYAVTAQDRRSGLFTSDELPRGMRRVPYDLPGDPELAHAIAAQAEPSGTWITAVDDHHLPISYATVNLWRYLGVPGVRWVSVSVCQTAEPDDDLRLGRALAAAVAAGDREVVLVASGALSHRFWPLRELRSHEAAGTEHIRTAEAAAADLRRIAWLTTGDHAAVLDTMDEFARFRPESGFSHYLMMSGALGAHRCRAPGRRYSEYENAAGTGQVHLWFDRPPDGWCGPGSNVL